MVCEDALRLEPASASASAPPPPTPTPTRRRGSRLPPGFDSMEIWSHIDCELYVARGRGGVGGGGAVRGTTAVCADLRVTVAADIPWGLRAVPYFDKIGEAAIGASIDVVANGAQERVQRAFEAWVEEGEAEVEGEGGGRAEATGGDERVRCREREGARETFEREMWRLKSIGVLMHENWDSSQRTRRRPPDE